MVGVKASRLQTEGLKDFWGTSFWILEALIAEAPAVWWQLFFNKTLAQYGVPHSRVLTVGSSNTSVESSTWVHL